jgi:hypothetical protein
MVRRRRQRDAPHLLVELLHEDRQIIHLILDVVREEIAAIRDVRLLQGAGRTPVAVNFSFVCKRIAPAERIGDRPPGLAF